MISIRKKKREAPAIVSDAIMNGVKDDIVAYSAASGVSQLCHKTHNTKERYQLRH